MAQVKIFIVSSFQPTRGKGEEERTAKELEDKINSWLSSPDNSSGKIVHIRQSQNEYTTTVSIFYTK